MCLFASKDQHDTSVLQISNADVIASDQLVDQLVRLVIWPNRKGSRTFGTTSIFTNVLEDIVGRVVSAMTNQVI